MTTHTDDCAGTDLCTPNSGLWDQPPGYLVEEIRYEFDDETPWCVIRKRALEHSAASTLD